MTTDTSPSASEIAADLTTACVHAWQAMGRQGASSPANAMHAAYAECQAAIEAAGPGLHLRCAKADAEIGILQAQVDALAECLNGALDYASQKMMASPAGRCQLNKCRAALAAAGR